VELNLGDLTAHAHALVDAGDLSGAQELLGRALSGADPDPTRATADLAEAADLYARVLVALGAPHDARPPASYAHAAAARLFGADDPRTLAAGTALAAILYRIGTAASRQRSAILFTSLIEQLSAVEGPEAQRVLYANADLAVLEHLRGEDTALDRMEVAWTQYNEVYGDQRPGAIRMLARLGAIERDAGMTDLAVEHLALARALSQSHFGADHPLATQIADFMSDVAGRDSEDTPVTTPVGVPDVAEAGHSSGIPPQRTPYDDTAPGTRRGRVSGVVAWPPVIADPLTNDLPSPSQQSPWFVRDVEEAPEPIETTGPAPPEMPPPVGGTATEQPARPRQYSEWIRRVVRRPRTEPPLFVPPRVNQGLLPVVIAALVVLVLAAIAVAAAGALVGDGRADQVAGPTVGPVVTVTPTTVSPGPTAVAPQPGNPPPSDFAVNDTRDVVTLNWTYPAGATGPVVISAGPRGREPRVIGERPAGTTSYVVHGLPRDADFCFSVGVRYAANTLSRGPTVCTARAGS
jgi:hypothetical protein